MSLEEAERIKGMIAGRPEAASIAERRDGFEAMAAAMPLPDDLSVETADLGGVPGRWVCAGEASGEAAMMWLHGGAFVLGSSESYTEFCARLSAASGARVFCPDYRLAPEHPFPAALDDAQAAWAAMPEAGRLWLGGDSCGGNLAVATVQAAARRGGRMPGALYLVSPYLDLTHTGESIEARGPRDPFVRPDRMEATAQTYLQGADASDPRASPLFGPMAGFPRTLVQVGADESLFDDASRLADRLTAAGAQAVLQEAPGMMHVYPFFGPWLEEGREAVRTAGRWLSARTPSAA
jgi:acetyl esterase/lipase